MARSLNLIAVLVLTSCVLIAGYTGAGTLVAQESQLSVTGAGERTARFELRSDPRVALHHFLLDWAASDAEEWPPYAPTLEEREDWRSVVGGEEQDVWTDAVEAYARTVGRSLVFDTGLVAVRD